MDGGEIRVLVEVNTDFGPDIPCGVVCVLSPMSDALGSRCFNSAEFMAESSSGCGGTSIQEGCVGNQVFI
jgi:hypothetical protein